MPERPEPEPEPDGGPPRGGSVSPRPLDPRTRALVIGIREALLLLADVLGAYAGVQKRVRGAG